MASLFVYPYSCILSNVPGFSVGGRYQCRDVSPLAESLIRLVYPVEAITPVVCSRTRHFTGVVRIQFAVGIDSAMSVFKLQEKFEEFGHSRAGWFGTCRPPQGPYLWVASVLDQEYYDYKPTYTKIPYAFRHSGRQAADADGVCEYSHVNIALCVMPPTSCAGR